VEKVEIVNETQIRGTYTREAVEENRIQISVEEGGDVLGMGEGPDPRAFRTTKPSDHELTALLRDYNQSVEEGQGPTVSFTATTEDDWLGTVLLWLIPVGVLVVAWMYFLRRANPGSQMLSIGENTATLFGASDRETVTFDDVAGVQNAKKELREIIEFLKDPSRFQRLGGEIPRGVLLVGPPGTGKTLLARAVAGEAEVPFFNMTGSDFMEMLVGVGASRIRDLFKEAKKSSPSIIFIDELDSIGRRRGAGLGGGHDEREQTLNQLLSEMDGFEPTHEVVVMAATNRPDILDPALLRPGRFDRRITVDLPTREARRQILELHAREKPLSSDVDLDEMARGTPGFSGADLKNLLNEAALLAAREDKDAIEREDIEEARDKVMMGLERENLALNDDERRLLAYHEGGHAVLAAVLTHADPLHKVTIVPRGKAMGVTQQLPEKDKYVYRKEYVLDRLAVMMGGRAAEDLVMDTATSGAANDLMQATKLARKMVLAWGMSERFKDIAFGGEREQVFLGEEIAQRREYSEDTAREVDEEIQGILSAAYERAVDTLRKQREGLDRLADALLEKEEIEAEEVFELLGLESRDGNRPPGAEAADTDAAGRDEATPVGEGSSGHPSTSGGDG
jgi:cell division protease FtsH